MWLEDRREASRQGRRPFLRALGYHIPKISRTELAGEVVSTEVQIHRVEFVNSSGGVSENPRDIRCETLPVPRR
jgi:hypothetical protein